MEKTTNIVTLTLKSKTIFGYLKTFETGATCYELIEKFAKELTEKGYNIAKINSVNAILASLATKGLVEKSKVVYNGKLVTKYTIIPQNKD